MGHPDGRRPHPRARTSKHARTRTHTRTSSQARARERAHAHTHTHTHTHAPAHERESAHAHAHTHANAPRTRTRTRASTSARARAGTRDDPPRQPAATACVFLDGPESPRPRKTRTVRARPAPQPGGAKRVGRSGAPTPTASPRQRRHTAVPTAVPHFVAGQAQFRAGVRPPDAHRGSFEDLLQDVSCVATRHGGGSRRDVAQDCHSLWRPRARGLGHHRRQGDPNRAAQVFSALVLALPIGIVQCCLCRPGQGPQPLWSRNHEVKRRRKSSNPGGQTQVCRPPPILCSRILARTSEMSNPGFSN